MTNVHKVRQTLVCMQRIWTHLWLVYAEPYKRPGSFWAQQLTHIAAICAIVGLVSLPHEFTAVPEKFTETTGVLERSGPVRINRNRAIWLVLRSNGAPSEYTIPYGTELLPRLKKAKGAEVAVWWRQEGAFGGTRRVYQLDVGGKTLVTPGPRVRSLARQKEQMHMVLLTSIAGVALWAVALPIMYVRGRGNG